MKIIYFFIKKKKILMKKKKFTHCINVSLKNKKKKKTFGLSRATGFFSG